MTKKVLTYAWTIIAAGLLVVASALVGLRSCSPRPFLICAGLAALAATFKLRLPNLTGTLSPAFVFLLVSIATRTWSETVIVAAISGIVQCIWHAHTRPSALQIAFNGATMAIAGGVAHAMGHGTSTLGGASSLLVTLGVAAVTLLIANTLLISTILCLIQEAEFRTIWRAIHLWAVPYYLTGGVLAGIWARVDMQQGLTGIVLAAASAYLLSIFYREVGRLARPFIKQDGCATC